MVTMSDKEKKLVRAQSLQDTKHRGFLSLFLRKKNKDVRNYSGEHDTRRSSLLTFPTFTSRSRNDLISPKKHTINETSANNNEITSLFDVISQSKRKSDSFAEEGLELLENPSPSSTAPSDDLMVCANALITKSSMSVRTPTPSRKNSKASPLSHSDLMDQVLTFNFDDKSIKTQLDNTTADKKESCLKCDTLNNEELTRNLERNIYKHRANLLLAEHLKNTSIFNSDSCLVNPGEQKCRPCLLKRNLTLPIKTVHFLSHKTNEQRTPCETEPFPPFLNRSLSEIHRRKSPKEKRTAHLLSYCHNDSDNLSFDYVQQWYGVMPESQGTLLENSNTETKCEPDSVDTTPCHSVYSSPSKSCGVTPLPSPYESPRSVNRRSKIFNFSRRSPVISPKKSPKFDSRKSKCYYDPDKESLTGYLYVNIDQGKGFHKNSDTYVILEIDSYGHFFKKARTKTARGSEPQWDEAFEFEIEACNSLRLTCYNRLRLMGDDICGKVNVNLTRENLIDGKNRSISVVLDRGQAMMNISLCFSTSIDGIQKSPSISRTGVFGLPISVVCSREKCDIPVVVISCLKEIEKRGMNEVGIYRLSGVASEIQNLKKLFNEQTQSAVLMLAETDIHAVAGVLKLYFRELPQSLFTSKLYHKFVEGFSITDPEEKELYMCDILHQLPRVNKMTALYLLEHLRRVVLLEAENKMGVNNLATVFGPTVLRPPSSSGDKENERSSCNVGSFDIGALDVMSQVGIFRYFLGLKNNERTKLPEDDLELWRRLDSEKAAKLEEKLMQSAEEFSNLSFLFYRHIK